MAKVKNITTIWLLTLSMTIVACYEEEHFDMPGPYFDEKVEDFSDLEFPFSEDKSLGIYLIKEGKPDPLRVSTRGYTDFVPEILADSYSWYEGTDRSGRNYFGSLQHRNFYALSDADNFGGDRFSFECNDLVCRPFMKMGMGNNWYLYARMTFESMGNNSYPTIAWEANTEWKMRMMTVFDYVSSNAPYLFFYRWSWMWPDNSYYYYLNNIYAPGEPFDFELIHLGGFVYCRINGKTIWLRNYDFEQHSFPIVFTPWMNALRVFDLYIEGDYEEQHVVAGQRESGYVTIQAPAVVKNGSELLLFAEGRKENIALTNSKKVVRSNATDIVIKRSSDDGTTWSEAEVVIGGDGSVNMRPTLLTDANGKIHLFYTVDISGRQDGNYALYTCSSVDGGKSWSASRKIEAEQDGYDVTTQGGKGLLRSDGSLIIPLKCEMGRFYSLMMLVSKDGGNSWTQGTMIKGNKNRFANLLEIDGKAIVYLCHEASGLYRTQAASDDGLNWSTPVDVKIPSGSSGKMTSGATVVTQNGTIVHFTGSGLVRGNEFITGSVGTSASSDITQRKQIYIHNSPDFGVGMTVTVSRDKGVTWSEAETLSDVTAYSYYRLLIGQADAVELDDGTVICIVESGVSVPYEGLLAFKKKVL